MINLPSGVKKNELIDDLRIFSWEASEIMLYYAQILKDSDYKSNILENNNLEDPVTAADLKVNELIINRINEKYKNVSWGILSEENVKLSSEMCNLSKEWIWILDPLDGTKDFIQGTGNYAMHLSLNYKQKPYIGIVLIPEKDELWIADGQKVWCESKEKLKRIPNLTNNKNLKDFKLVTSKNHSNKILGNLIERVGFKHVLVMGSVGCKIASILNAESDIYISISLPGKSAPKDWDFSAPEAILKAAGGSVTNIENQNLSYGKSNFEQGGIIVASNNVSRHKNICIELKEIIRNYNLYPF